MKTESKYNGLEIAVIGISGQFPGTDDHLEYWKRLCEGKEFSRTYSDEELLQCGVSENELKTGSYVRSASTLDNKAYFDSHFFEYRSEEAALMDPQIRIYHEQCWKALEDSGYASSLEKLKVGMFGGANDNLNFRMFSLLKAQSSGADSFLTDTISQRTYLTTLVSYKLNLRGPSFFVDTACSTSLVAVHLACRSLLTRECGIALAGGVSIGSDTKRGYQPQQGMIYSKDGRCRAFDAASTGTFHGEGVGVVVLKRLSDAIKDGDHIYAVIKSTAVNNDGNAKVGYTAPSVKGQSDCIRMAHKMADIDPKTISYVETHGTGTKLGDPVEVRALNEAFGGGSEKYCAIGSVKTNIGHLDSAAGIAGLIKTVLSLKNKKIPPSLHFTTANPDIDFAGGPFYVNAALKDWERKGDQPLRAGVSSFGIGGTNAHVVLEEAPAIENTGTEREYKLATISAKTERSLLRYQQNLLEFLNKESQTSLSDLCYTLQTGRKHFTYRKAIAFTDLQKLKEQLSKAESGIIKSKERNRPLVFMFPGQGSQYVNMGKGLYENEPVFKTEMDKGFAMLNSLTGTDHSTILYPASGQITPVNETQYTQPLIFVFEYALAQLLLSRGLQPATMIGHSIGEYVAACISGVMNYEDALRIVVKRGTLMGKVEAGAMISVAITEEQAREYLNDSISVAAVNGPEQLVFSGTHPAIAELIKELEIKQIPFVKLHTSHAFHSAMLNNVLEEFESELKKIKLQAPKLPFISNLTGKEITAEEATSAGYWSAHMRNTVKFSEGIQTLLAKKGDNIYVEVGAGNSLTTFLRQHQKEEMKSKGINLVRHPKEAEDDMMYLTDKIGQMWVQGAETDWKLIYKDEARRKISLPVYSFEKIKYPAEINIFSEAMLSKLAGSGYKDLEQLLPAENTDEYNVSAERPDVAASYKEPQTGTERSLVEIWKDFFGIDRVGIEDNFFELGGDSLKAMILLRRLESDFNIKLGLEEFFRYENIQQVAESIDEKLWLNKKSDKSYTSTI